MHIKIRIKVNGVDYSHEVEPRLLLVQYIRDVLRLTGTHVGCDTTSCGACTIHVNGKATKSCTMFAVQADGCEITTIEGLAINGELHPLQAGFKECHGLQCGFCTPGMIMTAAIFYSTILNQTNRKSVQHWKEISAAVQVITIL